MDLIKQEILESKLIQYNELMVLKELVEIFDQFKTFTKFEFNLGFAKVSRSIKKVRK